MYFLSGGVNATTWTIIGSRWPLYINLANNNAVFGGNVDCMSLTVNGLATFRSNIDTWLESNEGLARLYYANSSTTYIRGHGSGTVIEFRNKDDVAIGRFHSTGITEIYHEVWHKTMPDNVNRVQYKASGITNYMGYSTLGAATGDMFIWRDGHNLESEKLYRMRLTRNGVLQVYNSVSQMSDKRIKEDIQDVDGATELATFMKLKPKTFLYLDKINKGNERVHGFIAQEVKAVYPEAVIINTGTLDDGTAVDDFHNIVPNTIYNLNVCATQELHKRVEKQKERIEELEAKLASVLAHLNL